MLLDSWIQIRKNEGDSPQNTLVGYAYSVPGVERGQRVMTEAILYLDPINMEAVCKDGKYKLGDPGTVEEHNKPQRTRRTDIGKIIVNEDVFLKPRG